jgi:hypothetical protein
MAKEVIVNEGAFTQDMKRQINRNFDDLYDAVARCTTEFDADSGTTGDTLTDVVGMVVDVVPGTYRYYMHLKMLSTANGGVKAGLLFGTAAMLTSIANTARVFTATGVAVANTTTATDAALLTASTSAAISVVIEGTVVVALAGTLQLQAAQNVAHADNTVIHVGSFMQFQKIS